MKIEARMMMMSLENPEKASPTSRMPSRTRTHSRSRVATSTGIHSVANTTTIATSRNRTKKMGSVTRRYCARFLPVLDNPGGQPVLSPRPAAPPLGPAARGTRMEFVKGLLDFVLHLDKHLSPIIQQYGAWTYLLLFLIVFCETGLVVTPFLPGDSLLFAAGTFAALGDLDVRLMIVLLIIAAIVGDTVNYWVGAAVGPRAFQGNIRFLKREHLERTHAFYERHGGKTTILARFIPIIRTFAPFVAGVGAMSYGKFLTYNVVGAVVWVGGLVLAGFFFGNIPVVRENFSLVIMAIIAISVMPIAFEALRARR